MKTIKALTEAGLLKWDNENNLENFVPPNQ